MNSAGRGESAAPYAVLALDLDGTLLDPARQITRRSRDAICLARERGVTVLLASARPPRSMRGFHQELELDTPLIAYNGALVWDEAQGAPLLHTAILPEAARALIAFLRQRSPALNLSLECGNRWYIDALTEEVRRSIDEYGVDPPHGVGCLEQVLAGETEAISKVLFRGGDGEAAGLAKMLPQEIARGLEITTSGDWFCEVMAAGATKAAAIEWTARELGLDPRATMAIGDSPNDIPMLQAAALGIAMGNAPRVVMEAADAITASNIEEGVARAIERFLLAGSSGCGDE
jgi:Cof subfamily protein (haloacid dehalogenase superfamily)